jgi:hypothetical protein
VIVVELVCCLIRLVWLITTGRAPHVSTFLSKAGEFKGSGKPLIVLLTLDLFTGQNEEQMALLLELVCLSLTTP